MRTKRIRYWFVRGTRRNTTLSILKDVVDGELGTGKRRGGIPLISDLLLKTGKNDVLIHDNIGFVTIFLILFKPIMRYAFVLRVRGDYFVEIGDVFPRTSMLRKGLARFLMNRADYILFNSKYMQSRPHFRIYSSRSGVVYNPLMIASNSVDLEECRKQRASAVKLRLLTITRYSIPMKVRPLINALTTWIDPAFLEELNIEWNIVGDGDPEAFRKAVGTAQLGDRVKIFAFRKDVSQFYASSHVLVYITGLDAFPNVALEGSYYELPIITNRESCGTLEAMKDGETGLVVSNAEDFKDALRRYREDAGLRERHGATGRRFVLENYSIEKQRARATALLRAFFEGGAR